MTEPRRTRSDQIEHLSRWRERSARGLSRPSMAFEALGLLPGAARRVRVAYGEALHLAHIRLTRHPHPNPLPRAGEGAERAPYISIEAGAS